MRMIATVILYSMMLFVAIAYSIENQFSQQNVIHKNETPYPFYVHCSDLNSDSHQDVLVAAWGNIGWYENDGSGGFGTYNVIMEDITAYFISSSDFDKDGDDDIVCSLHETGLYNTKVVWFENKGDGNFGLPNDVDLCYTRNIFVSDLNGDGFSDILTPGSGWFKNDGAGNFIHQNIHIPEEFYPDDVFAADLDNDSDMDVILLYRSANNIGWYENEGDGELGDFKTISTTATGVESVCSSDIDGDGHVDIIAALSSDHSIVWYKSDGQVGYGSPQIISDNVTNPNFVLSVDLDDDGDEDVLYSQNRKKVAWCENYGYGRFSDAKIITSNALQPSAISTSDLDGDGDMDVVCASSEDHKIAWYENEGDGTFSDEKSLSPSLHDVRDLLVSDLDNDNDFDVIAAAYGDNKIVWYANDGSGSFGRQRLIDSNASGALSISVADLDGDGYQDLVSALFKDNEICWYQNNNTGEFNSNIITTDVEWPNFVKTADIDNDDHVDVLSTSRRDNKVAWYQNNGVGVFGAQRIISQDIIWPRSLNTVDFDNDSKLDVLVHSLSYESIVLFRNEGNGVFSEKQVISTDINHGNICAVDFDNDTFADIIVTSSSWGQSTVVWFKNDGAGNFVRQREIVIDDGDEGFKLFPSDFDQDGDMDLLVSSEQDNQIIWCENDGLGNVIEKHVVATNIIHLTLTDLYSIDLDGDCDMDVIASIDGGAKLVWYENKILASGINEQNKIAEIFSLSQNYPNPFNPSTKIEYTVKKPGFVSLNLYNVNGQRIQELLNAFKQPGHYSIDLDGDNLSSGIYYYKIRMGSGNKVRKMLKID